jgi:hypothetical protein
LPRNGPGDTELLPTNTLEGDSDLVLHVPIFSVFVLEGVVPPISPFLHTILTVYGLNFAHLHPSAVVILVVFQWLCEHFVGILSSLALFCHYFYPDLDP